MRNRKQLFRLIAKALGEKASECDKEADKVAFIRLIITSQILITNCFIIGGVIINVASIIRHWDNRKIEVVIDSSTLPVYQTPLPRTTNKPFEFE